MTLNCPFCYFQLQNCIENKLNNLAMGYCEYCNHYPNIDSVVIYFKNGELFSTNIYVTISTVNQNKQYLINTYYDQNKTYVSELASQGFHLDLPGSHISPQNAKEKLLLYLTFS